MSRSVVCDLLRIFKSSVSAVLPDNLVNRSVKYNSTLQQLTVVGDNYDLKNKNVYLIGFGKAVQNMAREVENVLSNKVKQGIISIPVGSLNHKTKHGKIFYLEGAEHNLPDAKAVTTATKIRDLVTELGSDDILLVLISGGGSALLPLPKPPITLDEKTSLIKKLANAGADIKELNTVRKRLSDLKGGQLAIRAQPAKVISLILSDIVGDPLDLIASGPTTENEDDPSKALAIINRYKVIHGLAESIISVLQNPPSQHKFPKNNVRNYIIGSNKMSIAAALKEAMSLDYVGIQLSDSVTGNVKTIATEYATLTKLFCSMLNGNITLADMMAKFKSLNIPGINTKILEDMDEDALRNKALCLVLGGEITVEVKGTGKGGRNQHLALEFSNLIDQSKDEFENFDIHLLSAGTDGIDGPTDAAGAIGYLNLISEAKKEHFNTQKYLDDNNSYNFYKEFKNGTFHVVTGHTNTNVMDIHILTIRRNK